MSLVSSLGVGSSFDLAGFPDPAAAAESQPLVVLPPPGTTGPVRKSVAVAGTKKMAEATSRHASDVLAEINQTLKMASIGVQLAFDKTADTMIASVVNLETGKVILQMSSEQLLPISKALVKLQDLLVYQKICHEAQLMTNSTEPASARWSRPWVTEVAADQQPRAFRSVNA